MATEQIKNQILIALLKENREKLNSLFSFYKFSFPAIEKDVVFFYISFVIEPVFDKNLNRDKEQLSSILISLYDKILELIGKNYLGNSGRYPFFENKFIQCIEEADDWMFENPDLYLSSISNAIINIGSVDILKLNLWLSKFQKISKKAKSIHELFEAGKVIAWISGMAQYRQRALEICRQLEVTLLETILDIPNLRNVNIENFFSRLEIYPWISLADAMKENSPRKVFNINRVGNFSGFGGKFITPPKVELTDQEFILYDKKNFYVLFVDFFGSHLERISEDTYLKLSSIRKKNIKSDFIVTKEGKIQNGKEKIQYSPLSNYSSIASNEHTCCITSPYSHSFFVVGMG
jgi:hypothetical protein